MRNCDIFANPLKGLISKKGAASYGVDLANFGRGS